MPMFYEADLDGLKNFLERAERDPELKAKADRAIEEWKAAGMPWPILGDGRLLGRDDVGRCPNCGHRPRP